MTGAGNPWNSTTNDAAMDAAFGVGGWTKIQGFSASAFTGSSFIFMDGGDNGATEFGNFITANSGAFSSCLNAGGRALVHAAPNQDDFASYALPNGLTLDGIAGFTNPTSSNNGGAGTSWTGGFFSHNPVFGGTGLITGTNGCILANEGNLWAGGETISNFHSTGGFQLRVNKLKLAAAGGVVPEPASWAMMIAGFGRVGAAMRRRAFATA